MSGKNQSPSPLPWKIRLGLSILSTVTDLAKRSDGSLNRSIVRLINFSVKANPAKPVKGVISTDITGDSARDNRLVNYCLPPENRDHEAFNVFGPKSSEILNISEFSATMVVIGGFDPLQDWQKRYYEGLKRRVTNKEVRLIEYPNAIHGFHTFSELPDTPLVIAEVIDFI
ncbi:hypothetical protein Scep_014116 [Stephania cephalantha]|uniref:Alpha/beta hydrolase fold-3 domain-containing protein n=1 Tax=Stephania cephalantha TaxID=152367 RepID=A0AAP0J1E8_9MAGN